MSNVLECSGYEIYNVNIVDAKGCYLYDDQGKRYVDLESGVWCTSIGHSHPRINKIIKEQIDKISHLGYRYRNPVVENAASKVLKILDFPNGKCVFLSSGSEAVEFGVKILRLVSKRPFLLGFAGSYLAAYGSAGNKNNEEWYSFDWTECNTCSGNCELSCPRLKEIPFDKIGGFVFEPGNTSGLVKLPPKKLVKSIEKLIKNNNGSIMINEITTGFGRTGEWFGYQHYNLKPDIVSMGKGMGSGYPVSAVALSEEFASRLAKEDYHYAQSHQNDALGCAVASEVINVILEEDLIEIGRKIGTEFKRKLQILKEKHDSINEIRGRGLMIALELKDTGDRSLLTFLHRELFKEGYLVGYNPRGNLLRFYPPLTIKENDIDNMIVILDRLLKEFR